MDDKDLLLQILNTQRDATKVFHIGITDLGRMISSFSGSLRNIAATDEGGFATLVNFMQQIRPEQSLKSLGQSIQVIGKGIFSLTGKTVSPDSGSFQLVNALYDVGSAISKAATGGFNYREGAKGEHNDERERVNFLLDEDIGPYKKPRPPKPEKPAKEPTPPKTSRTTSEDTPRRSTRSGSRASGDNPRARGTNPRALGNNPRSSSPFAGLEGLNIAALQVATLNVGAMNVAQTPAPIPSTTTLNSYLNTTPPPSPVSSTQSYLGGSAPIVPSAPEAPRVSSMTGADLLNLTGLSVPNVSTTSIPTPNPEKKDEGINTDEITDALANKFSDLFKKPPEISKPSIPLPPMPTLPGGGGMLTKLMGPISSAATGLSGLGGKLLAVATGPVGAIAVGITSALTAVWGFATTLKNAGAAILESYKGLAEVSGNFASLFAVRDVHKITMDMQRGAAIGDSANALSQSQMGLEKAMAPVSNFLDKLTNYSMALLIDLMTTIINLFLSPIETIKNMFIGFINLSLEMGAMIYEAIAWVVSWISKEGGDMVKSMAETARQMKIANEPKDEGGTDLAADLGNYQAGLRARFAQ